MGHVDIEWLLGTFRGRASRYHFLVGLLIIAAIVAITFFAFRMQKLTFCVMEPQTVKGRIYFTALIVIGLIVTYSGSAVMGKRLHDRGIPAFLAVFPWLGLWALPIVMRFEVDASCLAVTPLRIGIGGATVGIFALAVLFGLLIPGSRFGNRYGDSLRKPPTPIESSEADAL